MKYILAVGVAWFSSYLLIAFGVWDWGWPFQVGSARVSGRLLGAALVFSFGAAGLASAWEKGDE